MDETWGIVVDCGTDELFIVQALALYLPYISPISPPYLPHISPDELFIVQV